MYFLLVNDIYKKFIIIFIKMITPVDNRNIVNHINILVSKQDGVDQVNVL